MATDKAVDEMVIRYTQDAEYAFRKALESIANGNGYYGAQAKEYKEIAKAVLAQFPMRPTAESPTNTDLSDLSKFLPLMIKVINGQRASAEDKRAAKEYLNAKFGKFAG